MLSLFLCSRCFSVQWNHRAATHGAHLVPPDTRGKRCASSASGFSVFLPRLTVGCAREIVVTCTKPSFSFSTSDMFISVVKLNLDAITIKQSIQKCFVQPDSVVSCPSSPAPPTVYPQTRLLPSGITGLGGAAPSQAATEAGLGAAELFIPACVCPGVGRIKDTCLLWCT